MAGSRQGREQTTKEYQSKTVGQRKNYGYIQGNTVRKLDISTVIEEEPKKKLSVATRKNREKAVHMNMGYVMFLAVALFVAGVVLVGYIQLQFMNTNSVENIAVLESQLNNLRLENNEEYSRITSSVDLDEVKRVAIEELGMSYASEGQIITFSGEGSDYVRQYALIP